MRLLHLLFFSFTYGFVTCRLIRNGVFDNVTVLVKGLATEDVIFIDFGDSLREYVSNSSEVIIIQNQFIPKLEANSVSDLPKVSNLTLARNGIREIRRGAFKHLSSLKVMNLSFNQLEEIHNGVFNDLPVEDLYLDNNKISRIGYKAFSYLKLRNLFLNNNQISRWGKDWFADSSVLVLDVSYNLIADLPPNSFHLMSKPSGGSMSVIFSGNQLKKVNGKVFNRFDRFQTIALDGNFIKHLDANAFDGVEHVHLLNLNNNSISEIKGELLQNLHLDILMLEDNKLRCLSTDIFRMEELDIDGNPITCFCVKTWLEWRDHHSNPSIYHITNLEQECI